ncbi:MAG: hypothetical protein A2381_00665 [Bdellovibrionales bacterium RIFOXYB1_FULL_37_110]|nr:MAG: hypothetical protein A2417_01520 [Bdellovibrionales bacterium RIFOXYC1_FULL_37_79]OFZ58731.1 MAG: hypothetical protein A2381_00665 [Bdellovibrionales bacterium RIFOXYB1_FULL_37_110]OFZ64730.1 MAG: hypothetical protein A2577_06665 [Bdellovibrionales bacterium RIFOXYD1_FULL_36_51]
MSHEPWVWVAAFFTIAIFSYLWKENPLYRFAEHVLVGISVGYLVCITWENVLHPKLVEPILKNGEYVLIIPGIMAALMLFRFSQKIGWISFWPLAFLIGFSGYAIPTVIETNMLTQIQATVNTPLSGGWFELVSGLFIILGTLACLVYFYFSYPHKGVVGKTAQFGSMLLMVSFGASFGFTVMARISLLIGRVLFLLRDWLGVVS